MKLRIALLIVASILGVVAVFGVITYIGGIRAAVEEETEKINVLVAIQNIPKEVTVDSLIDTASVALEAIPRKYLADGVLTSLDNYKGYVIASPINRGEQITTTKFIRPEDVGLAFVVPEGMVAISIPVNEVVGVSKLINEGDRVNVIATFNMPENGSGTPEAIEFEEDTEETTLFQEEVVIDSKEVTRTVLWNVEVLYIGARTTRTVQQDRSFLEVEDTADRDARAIEMNTVTLALTPEDSEKIVFSEEFGSVWLALVPFDGVEERVTKGVGYLNLFE
jgi:pilus assembly protein CpaB